MVEVEDTLARVQALIAAEPPTVDHRDGMVVWLHRLCAAAVRALPASGAGVSVMSSDGSRGVAAASDPASGLIDELQFTLGEGPSVDAFSSRHPVLEPDLDHSAVNRWPMYWPAVQDRGVRAVFAFPLQVGAARLGVLDVYRREPGALSIPVLRQALTFAEVAVTTLLDGQREAVEGGAPDGLEQALEYRLELYQAQGMVMIQLGVSLFVAMARLRAYAYAQDRRLSDVAGDVVHRRITLDRHEP